MFLQALSSSCLLNKKKSRVLDRLYLFSQIGHFYPIKDMVNVVKYSALRKKSLRICQQPRNVN